jgi:histidyl-tRNA synthetase
MDELTSDQRELIRSIIGTKLSLNDLENYEPGFTAFKPAEEAWSKLKAVVQLLPNFNVPEDSMVIDLNIARGLDYYTGVVFEIDVPELGAEKQVCGGGVYSLLELFGGKPMGTIWFAIGFDRLLLALEAQKRKFDLPTPEIYVIPVGDEALEKAIEITSSLRAEGIYTELELKRRGPSKCLKYAANLGVKKAIIIGGDELASGSVTVKDMASGDQQKVEMNKLNDILK